LDLKFLVRNTLQGAEDMKALTVATLAFMTLAAPTLARFPQIHTTFRALQSSDTQPMTLADAKSNYYFEDVEPDQRFAAAHRMYRKSWEGKRSDKHLTDFTFLFDADGNVAGMQSAVPSQSFAQKCTDNQFYQTAKFTHTDSPNKFEVEYCLTTIYFRHPSTISTKGYKADPSEDILYLQKGASYDDAHLVAFPKKYKDAVEMLKNLMPSGKSTSISRAWDITSLARRATTTAKISCLSKDSMPMWVVLVGNASTLDLSGRMQTQL